VEAAVEVKVAVVVQDEVLLAVVAGLRPAKAIPTRSWELLTAAVSQCRECTVL
jgi:hypothetical protein